MSPQVRTAVAVCVHRDDKVLFIKRLGSHGEGSWAFPGGHLEFGESWGACAQREVMEELGIAIKDVHFLTVANDIFKAENKHYTTIYLEADLGSGKPAIQEPDRITDITWASLKKLPQPLFEPCWTNLLAIKPELFR